MSVQIHLLGPFRVSAGPRILIDAAWPRLRAQRLVKLLALQPTLCIHRDVAMEALWAGLAPDAASANLRQTTKQIRSHCGPSFPPLVAVDGELVTLAGGPWVDVHAFTRAAESALRTPDAGIDALERAVALWGGEPLPADAYEPWAEPHCQRLARMHRDLLVALATRYASAGDHAAAEARLRDALLADQLDEDVHRRLMRLYLEMGRADQVLRQYERLREILADELDLKPSDETESLVSAIKSRRALEPTPPCPKIRHATTSDGVRIAYWSIGRGQPLIIMPTPPLSHIKREWQIHEIRRWYQRLAAGRMIVRYDGRNTGSSDRGVPRTGPADQARDLAAVIEALSLPAADLYASMTITPAAILFAASQPRMVRRMVIEHGHARGAELFGDAGTRIAVTAIEQDWFVYSDLVARALCGWVEEPCMPALREMYLDSSTPVDAKAFLPVSAAVDVSDALPAVQAPTLVLHRRGTNAVPLTLSQALAAGIPNARLALFEGAASAPFVGDSDAILAELTAFLA